jgi:hypothetical protein
MLDALGFFVALLLIVAAVVGGAYLGYRSSPWPLLNAGSRVVGFSRVRRSAIVTLAAVVGGLPLLIAGVLLGVPPVILIVYSAAIALGAAGLLIVMLRTKDPGTPLG